MRVPYEEMKAQFVRVLEKYGMPRQDADLSASLFATASLEGVYTHGLNRFPKFMKSVDNGSVRIQERASCVETVGPLERWDGHRGPGNLNAYAAMERAIALAKKQVFGIVTLKNTNHWMRPGSYGELAAQNDCIGVLWTNTTPNMPPWGAVDPHIGNNPMVIAIPHNPVPVLLDVAMSMFSYGKLEKYVMEGKKLPVPGGYDRDGKVTDDPAAILETHQVFPIGYWKGSGMSLALDLIVAVLAGGRTTCEIGKLPTETELSQCFLAINLAAFPDRAEIERKIDASIEDLKHAVPRTGCPNVRFPGEGLVATREENTRLGIPVDEPVWEKVKAM